MRDSDYEYNPINHENIRSRLIIYTCQFDSINGIVITIAFQFPPDKLERVHPFLVNLYPDMHSHLAELATKWALLEQRMHFGTMSNTPTSWYFMFPP